MGKQSAPRRNADNEARASVRSIRTSPRKLNLVAASIRGMTAAAALNDLMFNTRRVSGVVKKALESAVANAECNHDLDIDRLVVSEAFVGKSLTMKRWRPRARGRVGKIVKPFSTLTIVVRERGEFE